MNEMWKDIVGYEGFYQVSNLGRIKRLEHSDDYGHKYKERIVKPAQASKAGYLHVHLSKNGVAKWHSVHRLVAEAFVEKKDGCDIVNHLDNNPSNNNAENLEWTTYKGNMQHATKQGRMKHNPENLRKAQEAKKIPVIAIKDGERLYFQSGADAAKALGINSGHIAACCRKEYGYNQIGGYEFEYADKDLQKKQKPNKEKMSDEERIEFFRKRMIGNQIMKGKKLSDETIEKLRKTQTKPVIQFSLDGKALAEYYSTQEAKRVTGISHIDGCCRGERKTAGGFIWRYKE